MTNKLQFHLDGFDKRSERMVLQIHDESDILTPELVRSIVTTIPESDPEVCAGEYPLTEDQATKLLGMFGHAPNMETTEYYVGRVSLTWPPEDTRTSERQLETPLRLQFHLDGFDKRSEEQVLEIFDENDILTRDMVRSIVTQIPDTDPEVYGGYSLTEDQATKLLGMFGHTPDFETTNYSIGRVSLPDDAEQVG